ncbi:MAG: amidophosphoribosyltransferase [Pseudomonadota bacterium]
MAEQMTKQASDTAEVEGTVEDNSVEGSPAPSELEAAARWRAHPFDVGDGEAAAFREECGVFGVFDVDAAARFVALGLHALQHRGQEAAGVGAYDETQDRFHVERRMGLVSDNFNKQEVLERLPGRYAVGHNRYSTSGAKEQTELRDIQPLYAEFAQGGMALAHNGNFTNARQVRDRMISQHGAIFQSSSDTECVMHLMARSTEETAAARLEAALKQMEGAFSIVALTSEQMIGVRDPLGVRPLVIGRLDDGYVLASETVALDIVNAEYIRDVSPGEMIVIDRRGLRSHWPFRRGPGRFCIFEYVYFSRPDSAIQGQSVYEVRQRIGEELAMMAPVEADLVCPVPDSGTPAALGFAAASNIPFAYGIVKHQYVGRTFIEPTKQMRDMKVRLKLNVNRRMVQGKRVVLVDDSVVRGTTSRMIKDMVLEAGAKEVHFRIASPPTSWPCFYGVDTPDRDALMAARMTEEQMRDELGVTSLRFITLDGLYRACGIDEGRDAHAPKFCDACFSGAYPFEPADAVDDGRLPAPSQRPKACA